MKRDFGPRKTANLSKSIQQQLNKYAFAASAAGVGTLALAAPAAGKIVYTKAHHVIGVNQIFYLDLNHDGVSDFTFINQSYCTGACFASLWVGHYSANGNEIRGGGNHFAFALRTGVRIGSKEHFSSNRLMAMAVEVEGEDFEGPWTNNGKAVKDRYLGLKFNIDKKIHFGWARLNVVFNGYNGFIATLTGYAYETIPNKSIIAGQTKGPDISVEEPDAALIMPTPERATLGALAMGSPGLSIWRREESAGGQGR